MSEVGVGIQEQVSEAYRSADFLAANWNPEKHRVKTKATLTAVQEPERLESYLTKLFNHGNNALTLNGPQQSTGTLTPEQANQYRQDAILSVTNEFAGYYISSLPEFTNCTEEKAKHARNIQSALGSILGQENADRLLLTASFSTMLKRVNRDDLIEAANNITGLKARLTESRDLTAIGLNKNKQVAPALKTAINTEIERRKIGTDNEQMKHLTQEFTANMIIPAVLTAIALSPTVAGYYFGNIIDKYGAQDNPSPWLIPALRTGFIIAGASISKQLISDVFPIKTMVKPTAETYINAIKQYKKTNKAPGTPKI